MVNKNHSDAGKSDMSTANKALACVLTVALGAGMLPVLNQPEAFAAEDSVDQTASERVSDKSASASENETDQSTEDASSQDEANENESASAETAPGANENAVMGSSARSAQNESADASESASDPQQENSWRFANGQPLAPEDIDTTGDSARKARSIVNNGGYKAFDWFDAVGGACPSEGASTGIDVSEHNGNINWTAVRNAGVNFAVIRCGYGQNYSSQDDKKWMQNVQGCNAAGMPFGVYLYSYAKDTASARSEADHVVRCLKAAQSHLGNFKLPIYYDMEDSTTESANLTAIAQAFMGRLAEHGYRNVGVYANTSWWNNKLTDSCFNSWHRWVAQYNTTGLVYSKFNKNNDIWQFSSAGAVDGISGKTDLNYSHISSLPRRSGWSWHGSHWMYWEGGEAVKSCTKVIGGSTYRFNASGRMLTGWVKEGNTWYWHQSNGAMAKGWVYMADHNYYYFDPSTGVMKTGWYSEPGGRRFYSNSSGVMQKGWLKDGGKWYWLQSNGAMATNRWISGIYWVGSDGVMATSAWVDNNRYYVNAGGVWVPNAKR